MASTATVSSSINIYKISAKVPVIETLTKTMKTLLLLFTLMHHKLQYVNVIDSISLNLVHFALQ